MTLPNTLEALAPYLKKAAENAKKKTWREVLEAEKKDRAEKP